eukprot:2448202-Rhodomonas_salina.2
MAWLRELGCSVRQRRMRFGGKRGWKRSGLSGSEERFSDQKIDLRSLTMSCANNPSVDGGLVDGTES